MEHIAPLIQTVLWVALIGGILWRFNVPLHGLLTALQKRVEDGSNIKAGPFELTEKLKPQDPTAQKAKVATEIQEELEATLPASSVEQSVATRAHSALAKYFQAEDLALRAIQADYGSPISRQVTAGRDGGFDGVFMEGGRTTVVEVKYVSGDTSPRRFRDTISRITGAIQQYKWSNPQIVLALVFERSADVETLRARLAPLFAENPVPVVIRCYTIAELQARFGLGDRDAG